MGPASVCSLMWGSERSGGKERVLEARGEGELAMSLERRRCLAVARRAGKGGGARWFERRLLMKWGEGVGRPEERSAAVRLLAVRVAGVVMIVALFWVAGEVKCALRREICQPRVLRFQPCSIKPCDLAERRLFSAESNIKSQKKEGSLNRLWYGNCL